MVNGKQSNGNHHVRVFDGFQLSEMTTVVTKNGLISDRKDAAVAIDGKGGFLMPGRIDSHSHLTRKNAKACVRVGVTATFSISSTEKVKGLSDSTRIFSTHGRALGSCEDGKAFVAEEAANGAAYIKIVVEDRPMMAKTRITQDVMNVIAEETHKRGTAAGDPRCLCAYPPNGH